MKGCFIRICSLPLVIGGIYLLLFLPYPHFLQEISSPTEEVVKTAVIAGLCLWFCILSFLDGKRYVSELAQLNRGHLKDGEETTVSGTIETKSPFLRSPFADQECIGYCYQGSCSVSRGGTGYKSRWTYYEGCALLSSIIRSPFGNVRILAEPDIELFHEVQLVKITNPLKRARNYLQSCVFEKKVTGPGEFKIDIRRGSPPETESIDFEEQTLKSGDRVLVCGIYSSQLGGIKPNPDSIIRPFHIIPDGETVLARKLRNRKISTVISFGLSLLTIAIYYFIFGTGMPIV